MQHSFWLLQQELVAYTDYRNYISRKDAPIILFDDLVMYMIDTFAWIPTLNPALQGCPIGSGINRFGPTIIPSTSGVLLQKICDAWAALFACGPEVLHMHLRSLDEKRERCVQSLTALANFGAQAASAPYFILHIGV